MTDANDVRKRVSQAYAKAVNTPAVDSGGCCTPSQKGAAARSAGYTSRQLSSVPKDAVINAFGCGNPLAFSEVREGDVVVDLGCGAGIDILLAAAKVGPRGKAIGVDMTDEMLDRAKKNLQEAGAENAEVRKGTIENLPLEDRSVDWVISNCVINLSPEKDRVFAEIARVLRPGGRMAVSDIVARNLPASVRKSDVLYNCCVGGAISEEDYVAGLERAGLVDVEVRERIVYDHHQLESLITSERPDSQQLASCCGGAPDDSGDIPTGRLHELAEALAGNVWSAKIHARKPEA